MRRRALLIGGRKEPNTIIGGIGSVITTKSALATKLGVSENIIKSFEVIGNDVHSYITEDYALPHEVFAFDSDITSFCDYDGHSQFIGGLTGQFRNSNIRYAFLGSGGSIGVSCFSSSMVQKIDAPFKTSLNNLSIDACSYLHTLNAPLLTHFSIWSMRGTTALADINSKPVTLINQSFQNSGVPYLDLTNLISCETSALYNSKLLILNAPAIIDMTHNTPIGSLTMCESAFINNLENITNSNNFFINWTSCNLIEMKKLKTYGTLAAGGGTGAQYGFSTLKMGCTIKVHEDISTANSGAPHEAFVWVKANRGATVEFYDDSGNYVSTL